ncbi:MAG TPA: YifB family Mg chelatase-like AAA ATPase [Ilumatobacteraceae bacterium]|nr:YifB family Mg chelatase-like AAA ATPase [Ilumatobacteraceae bacterium]
MFASIASAMVFGAEGYPIQVEVQVSKGLPGFKMVGRPDETTREARDRARAALQSSGVDWPTANITVNLAPSNDRKSGSGLDLALAVGVLVAAEVIPAEAVEGLAFIAELGLDGSLRRVPGMVPMVGVLGQCDVVVPVGSAVEAGVAALGRVRPVAHVAELLDVLIGEAPWPDHDLGDPSPVDDDDGGPDLADVHGQPLARRALEIAAAGGHHTLFVGPPGAGKTMLAARLPGLLPHLDRTRALEATMVHSAAGAPLPPGGLVRRPPFRAPHHSTSAIALIGGGSQTLRPGEISMAHCGVLFLDELAEFAPSVLDGLRQPLEQRVVTVDRAQLHAVLPADFLLVAAMNPCPCGGGPPGSCVCGDAVLHRYARRVSGPLLDRFDLRVNVHRPAVGDLLASEPGESSAVVAARVEVARHLAIERQGGLNSGLSAGQLEVVAKLDAGAHAQLRTELEAGRLSGRGYHRVRRVARTVADLRGDRSDTVGEDDVALALRFRASLASALRTGRVA